MRPLLHQLIKVGLALLCQTALVNPASALPYGSADTRSLAMGGSGIAKSSILGAARMNPALISLNSGGATGVSGRWHYLLPNLSVNAADTSDLFDTIDYFQERDYLGQFELALANYENALSSYERNLGLAGSAQNAKENLLQHAADVELSAKLLNFGLNAISEKVLRAHVSGALAMVNVASEAESWRRGVSVALFTDTNLHVGGYATFTEADNRFLRGFSNTFYKANQILVDEGEFDDQFFADGKDFIDPIGENLLSSDVRLLAHWVTQVGVSLSRQFQWGGRTVSLGLTPKWVTVTTYDYIADIDLFEEDDAEQDEVSQSDFNLDLGGAVYLDKAQRWSLGVGIQNLLKREYATPTNNVFAIEPALRAGVAYEMETLILQADLDLTENEIVGAAVSQYLGLGFEYIVSNSFRLRGGYRHNLADTEAELWTGGLGWNPGKITADLTGMLAAGEMSIAFQFGFAF